MRDARWRRPTPPWRPWRSVTSPSRSRSLRIFRTKTGLVLRLFAISSEVVPSSPAHATKLMMWTALARRVFAAINRTVTVMVTPSSPNPRTEHDVQTAVQRRAGVGLLQVRRKLRQRLEVGRVVLDHHPRLAVAGDLLDALD